MADPWGYLKAGTTVDIQHTKPTAYSKLCALTLAVFSEQECGKCITIDKPQHQKIITSTPADWLHVIISDIYFAWLPSATNSSGFLLDIWVELTSGIPKQCLIECEGFGEACQRVFTLFHLSYARMKMKNWLPKKIPLKFAWLSFNSYHIPPLSSFSLSQSLWCRLNVRVQRTSICKWIN